MMIHSQPSDIRRSSGSTYDNSTYEKMANAKCQYSSMGRTVYLDVDLDKLTSNIATVRKVSLNPTAVVCAMVKGNGYGHGAVEVSRHLKKIGVERLGVAAITEALQLREHGITGPIHLMGNVHASEMQICMENSIIPTVSCREAIHGMAQAINNAALSAHKSLGNTIALEEETAPPAGTIHIKIDTGMSRNGCQPDELDDLVELCEELNVPLEGMYSHFADYEETDFTTNQLNLFYETIKPYRSENYLFHISNSGGIITGQGSELDMVRPGICIYGLPPGGDSATFSDMGFQPIASLLGTPSLVKNLPAGRVVGYGLTYKTDCEQYVATFPIGYGDGYFRSLSNKGCVRRNLTGELCPLVGRVSMDAITFRVSEKPSETETFTLISADFDPVISATGMAEMVGTINYEITTRLASRIPRVYTGKESGTTIDNLVNVQAY